MTIFINIRYTECLYAVLCLKAPEFLALSVVNVNLIPYGTTDDLGSTTAGNIIGIDRTNALRRINRGDRMLEVGIPDGDFFIFQADNDFVLCMCAAIPTFVDRDTSRPVLLILK